MRLDEGVIRELHWHKEAEWAYVLDGEVRVTALDYEGGNFIDDLKKGDIWVSIYLPFYLPDLPSNFGPGTTDPKANIVLSLVFPQRRASLPARLKPQWNGISSHL
jgi:hypothetical protein